MFGHFSSLLKPYKVCGKNINLLNLEIETVNLTD